MDIAVFATHEVPTVLRALRTALAPDGAVGAAGRRFLDAYARIVGASPPGPDLPPLAADAVSLEGRRQRLRLVQLAVLAALLARPVEPASVRYVRSLAERLSIREPAIEVLEALAVGRRRRVRLLAMRRAFPALYGDAYRAEGVRGVLRFAAAMLLKLPVNTDRRWAFKRLGLLPEGTLGREYWAHMARVGFGLPGEPGGIAAFIAYHDLGHLLADHETTALGEIQQGSFQGGSRRDDGFFFVQFVVLHFHHGVQIAPDAPPALDCFDPEKVLWAIHRGACCTVDVTRGWDYWPLMSLPLDDARARIGLLPKTPPWRRAVAVGTTTCGS